MPGLFLLRLSSIAEERQQTAAGTSSRPRHSPRADQAHSTPVRRSIMRSLIIPVVALGAVLAAGGADAKDMRRGSNIILSPPPVVSATPVAPVPTVNSGALSPLPQTTLGTPLGNPGLISPLTQSSNFGALPGEPGSPTFDPN